MSETDLLNYFKSQRDRGYHTLVTLHNCEKLPITEAITALTDSSTKATDPVMYDVTQFWFMAG